MSSSVETFKNLKTTGIWSSKTTRRDVQVNRSWKLLKDFYSWRNQISVSLECWKMVTLQFSEKRCVARGNHSKDLRVYETPGLFCDFFIFYRDSLTLLSLFKNSIHSQHSYRIKMKYGDWLRKRSKKLGINISSTIRKISEKNGKT